MTRRLDSGSLATLSAVLEDGGYTVDAVEFEGVGNSLLAETPYALVSGITADWEDLDARVAEAQASLTTIAAEDPSARRWDLYVVAVVPGMSVPSHDAIREAIESDTRYARKLVVVGGRDKVRTERAVRALLPLQPPADISRIDAIDAIRAGLVEQGVNAPLAEAALKAFVSRSEVQIP